MDLRFDPIHGKTAEIIDAMMASPDMPEDDSLRFKLNLCIEEAVGNVVNYAYEGGMGYIDVHTDLEDGVLTIRLTDSGKPFNPLEKDDPDITLSAEDREIGGLGIFLCKQMMDSLDYRYEQGRNIFTMKLKVN